MKNLFLRSGLALACALSLVACGGDDGNLYLAGEVRGLSKEGLTIANNNGPALAIPAGSTRFQFPELISADQRFNIEIKTQPKGALCAIDNGVGKSGAYSIQNVLIRCASIPRHLRGTVNGVTAPDLILNNGTDQVEIAPGQTSFTMTKYDSAGEPVSGMVGDGSPFGVTVLRPPKGQTCSVVNGTGIMGETDFTGVVVNCQLSPAVAP